MASEKEIKMGIVNLGPVQEMDTWIGWGSVVL
jgi:hypothetical protein